MRHSRYLRHALFIVVGFTVLFLASENSMSFRSQSQPSLFQHFRDAVRSKNSSPPAELPELHSLSRENPASQVDTISAKHQDPVVAEESKQEGVGVKQNNPVARVNATFVTLARNSDISDLAGTIKQIENIFNSRYNYDWVFLNDKEFDNNFKRIATRLVSGKAKFGKISSSQWSFPDHIDVEKAAQVREKMKEQKIIYGDSVSYRHMCRYQSGFFFLHPLMSEYEYYWRVEPSAEFFCDMPFDPFRVMVEEKKKYGFVMSLLEYVETIPSLWNTTKTFFKQNPDYMAKDNSMGFISDDGGYSYNRCHFWSNFEIASLSWLRSPAYMDYFKYLDQAGGFFYERWGDAPVHSLAAALMLNKNEIHFFNEIGYFHSPFTHCPTGNQAKDKLRCYCEAKDNFDWKQYSCTSRWFDFMGLQKPEGYENEPS